MFTIRPLFVSIEPLETRIAPAVFYVSGLTVFAQNGDAANNQGAETDAATDAGADFSFLLGAGDSLVFDVNGDRALDETPGSGEFTLVNVTGGKAMVYFTDLDANMKFDADEITGLAVSNGFKATINTDIRGSIATTLIGGNPNGDLVTETELQDSTIDGLTIAGRVTGSIIAGGNISNVKIGPGIYSTGYSVTSILAGTAGSGAALDFNDTRVGGTFTLDPFVENSTGANLTNIALANGAALVQAGDGADADGSASVGGSIVTLNVTTSVAAMSVRAGTGGDSVNGAGGAGGSISKSVVNITGTTTADTINFRAGNGGIGKTGGGAGGAILDSTLAVYSPVNSILISAGNGGTSTEGKGGAGGALTNGVFRAADNVGAFTGNDLTNAGRFDIFAGDGGISSTLDGGAGGAVTNVTVQAFGQKIGRLNFTAGDGALGAQGSGGAGGAFTASKVLVTSQIGSTGGGDVTEVVIAAGEGANGLVTGGAGGASTANSVRLLGNVLANNGVTIAAGDGGDLLAASASKASKAGGNGGVLHTLTLEVRDITDDLSVTAGDGGNGGGGANLGAGGNGGAFTGVTATFIGDIDENVFFLAGAGGDGGSLANSKAKGGLGGAVSAITVANYGALDGSNNDPRVFLVAAGEGGSGGGTGAGAKGGNADKVMLTVTGSQFNFSVEAGQGGDGGTAGGIGAAGGNVTGINANLTGSLTQLHVNAGDGGNSFGKAAGAVGGTASNVIVKASGSLSEEFIIEAGAGGDADDFGAGGKGGEVKTIRAEGMIRGRSEFNAGNGGDAGNDAANSAASGAGGNVSDITILSRNSIGNDDDNDVEGVYFRGGDGGSSGAANKSAGGLGGSISKLTLDLTQVTGGMIIDLGRGGNGGTAGGAGGHGGSLQGALIRAGSLTESDGPGDFSILGGGGGTGGQNGAGGNAGNISASTIEIGSVSNELRIRTNAGGSTSGAGSSGKGGNGGSVTGISLTFSSTDWLDIGGSAGGSGKGGGAGGNVNKLAIIGGDSGGNDATSVSFRIAGGAGGTGQNSSLGGNGGSLNGVSIFIDDVRENAGLVLLGGAGGSGSKGGVGGSVTALTLDAGTISSDTPNFTVLAGRGGDGETAGGKGGQLSAITATVTDISDNDTPPLDGDTIFASGDGGNVTGAKGVGGQAGNIAKLTFTVKGELESDLQIIAGKSGNSIATNGLKGGAIQGLTLQNYGPTLGSVTIAGGLGGAVVSGTGTAGAGGDATGVIWTNLGRIDGAITVRGGHGGAMTGATGSGANGGQLSGVLFDNYGDLVSNSTFLSGSGSNAAATGNGGSSGNVTGITLHDYYGAAGTLHIAAGSGGNGAGVGSKGGDTGTLSKLVLDGVASTFGLGRSTTALNAGTGETLGGSGGAITGVTGNVGRLFITAPDGGAATGLTGKGGDGASVNGIAIQAVSDFVRIIAAGDGGAGGANGVGGAGGNLGAIKVAGDIGDFSSTFGFAAITSGQGGLAAGLGGVGGTLGKNGSIAGITADRIAAIIAGKAAANTLTAANAVFSLTGITAFTVGADVNGDGLFTFADLNPPADFDLGSDIPTDGFVLVRTGGAGALPVPTLKLVEA